MKQNHAFLIMAHKEPKLLERICKQLSSPNHHLFIHIDKKSPLAPFSSVLGDIPNCYIMTENERLEVSWGGYSQIAAEIALLKMAYKNENMDYFHLISGNDFPCMSNQDIDNFFEQHSEQSFMKYDSDEEVRIWRKDKYPKRYRNYHYHDKTSNASILLNSFRYIIKIWQKQFGYLRSPIENVYGGWQWFSWHRSVVKYVLDYIELHPKYLERMRYTACMDELFFHTMLHPVLDTLNIEKDNALRYIDWHPRRAYKSLPLILTEEDYSAIIKSGAMFCRKVNLDDSSKLIELLQSKIYNR